MDLLIAAHTDVVIRKKTNQDSVLIKVADTDCGKVCFAAVCDGMGGLRKGELASATLIRDFSDWFDSEFPEILYEGLDTIVLRKSWEREWFAPGDFIRMVFRRRRSGRYRKVLCV